MDNMVYRYFADNIETVSKEELLEALKDALQSAEYWRQASLMGFLPLNRKAAVRKDGHRED